MDFKVADDAPFPRERVYRTHRDDLLLLAPRLPEVERIQLRGRTVNADGTMVLRHEWTGKSSVLPLFLRPMVPAQMLRWEQEATWNPHTWSCAWQVRVPALGPMADIRGEQHYLPTDAGCRITLEGRFDFHPERVPQLPMPPGATAFVERFVVALIVPLVQRSGRAVIDHLDEVDRRG